MSDWPEQWQWLIGWLDNRHLMLWMPHRGPDEVSVLDPFNGDTYQLDHDLPSFTPTTWDYPAWVLYNSTLDKVAYASGAWGTDVSLRDVQSDRLLWTGATYEKPQWSPDGSTLAVAYDTCEGCTALITIGSSGEVTWLVDPTDPNSDADFIDLRGISWSPDGSRIAAWAGIPSPDCCYVASWHLILVDVRTRQATDTCVNDDGFLVARPIWSPDGRWVAVEHWQELGDWDWQHGTALVGVHRSQVFELPGIVSPFAWMTSAQ